MAMALGVTASAYAANPFSDVPAGHWAYDSISKLAAAGIIEGYGDDTFRGDRLMTRYEMAQIVAKALAKGANVDKLAAEFADELDALGVRVAALEKKSDNVKITGQFRYHYTMTKHDGAKTHGSKLRSRITFTGKVNDTWDYVGMLQNEQDLRDEVGNEGTDFQRAYLQGRLGGVKVVAGRQDFVGTTFDDLVYGSRMDGIKISYGKKINVMGYYGKPSHTSDAGKLTTRAVGAHPDKMFGVGVKADFTDAIGLHAGYDGFKADKGVDKDAHILNAGLDFKFGKDFKLDATWLHTNSDAAKAANGSSNGMVFGLGYKGAKASTPGSWGLGVKYYHAPGGAVVQSGWSSTDPLHPIANEGFKGLYAKANYAVAKNMVAQVEYWDLKGRETNDKYKTLWTHFVVTF
jgi:hypothetical protein